FLTLRTREVALTRETLVALGLDGIISLAELARILGGRYTATKNTNGDYVRVVVLPKRQIQALATTTTTTTS
ncbi:MAG: hypothetical protein QXH81_10045, partial [Thermofilaceae archaeon]